MSDSNAKKTLDQIWQALEEEEALQAATEALAPKSGTQDDAVVQVGGHHYVLSKDGKLIPADYEVKITVALTALEAHRLRAYAKKQRKSITALVREALSPITRPKPS